MVRPDGAVSVFEFTLHNDYIGIAYAKCLLKSSGADPGEIYTESAMSYWVKIRHCFQGACMRVKHKAHVNLRFIAVDSCRKSSNWPPPLNNPPC